MISLNEYVAGGYVGPRPVIFPKNTTRKKRLRAVDLFCGAGGESQGITDACTEAGYEVDLLAINHWLIAIETHKANHPKAKTLCMNLNQVDPRRLFKEGDIDILCASPECTFHSVARGGKPINDQSRITAFCVQRWIDACLPKYVIIENVPEFRNWGPLMRKRITVLYRPSFKKWLRTHPRGTRTKWKKVKKIPKQILAWVPDPAHKGEIFNAYIAQIEALGYKVQHRVLVCANFGDATTRERLFIYCVRNNSRKKIIWPNDTHSEVADTSKDDLFGQKREQWLSARDHVIDRALKGHSIFDRDRPLVENTIRRIIFGWLKFGIEPYLAQASNLVKLKGTNHCADIDKPLPTQGCSTTNGVQESCLIEVNHGAGGKDDSHRAKSDRKTLNAVTGSRGVGTAEYLIETDQTGGNGSCVRSNKKPIGAIVTKNNKAVLASDVTPVVNEEAEFTVGAGGPARAGEPRSTRKPTKSVLTRSMTGVAQPTMEFILNLKGTSTAMSADKPTPALTAHAAHLAIGEASFILPNEGIHKGNAPRSPNRPLPGLTAEHGAGKLVEALTEAFTLAQNSSASARHVKQPIASLQTAGAVSLNTVYLIKFYGSGGQLQAINIPLGAVTTKDRFALVEVLLERFMECAQRRERPIISINGQKYFLDILFRMLQWPELARAMSFRDGYKFTGTASEIVKQIGNAVPRKTARALVKAAVTQNPNVNN